MLLQANDLVLFQSDLNSKTTEPASQAVCEACCTSTNWPMFVAAKLMAEYPSMHMQFVRGCHSYEDIASVGEQWDSQCLQVRPTVLSLLFGAQETLRRFCGDPYLDVQAFHHRYAQLLEQTRIALPHTRLILCEPYLLGHDLVTEDYLQDLCQRQAIVRQLAIVFGATFVPLQAMLTKASAHRGAGYYLFDGVHPTPAGHWLIARQWLDVVVGTQQSQCQVESETAA